MPLLDLPNELLLAIAKPLDSQRDINALVQTNRHFYNILNSCLYAHNVKYHRGFALEWSATNGVLESAKKSIQQGAQIQIGDSSQPLLNAANNGHANMVAYLISLGANLQSEERGAIKRTPIQWAILHNHPEVVTVLIEKGIDPDEKDKKGQSLLHLAAKVSTRNNEDVTRVLIAKGANIESRNLLTETPLRVACASGSVEVALCLIEHGADINHNHNPHDDDDGTLLHLAARKNQVQIAQMLFQKGASIEATDRHKHTPLHIACYNGHKQIALFLLDKGADIEAKSIVANRPLHLATIWETKIDRIDETLRVTTLLLARGAYPEPKNNSGITPLHCAMKKENDALCKILLDCDIDPAPRDHRGRTPLHFLPMSYCANTARLLLQRGASVQPQDSNGDTPLHMAASKMVPDLVAQLLAAGADWNTRNKQNKVAYDLTEFSSQWPEDLWPENEARDLLRAANLTHEGRDG
jgi:ankyrin repeat protein